MYKVYCWSQNDAIAIVARKGEENLTLKVNFPQCIKCAPFFFLPTIHHFGDEQYTYTALSLVFSTNVVCVKTQQKHCSILSNIMIKPNNSIIKQLKNMIQSRGRNSFSCAWIKLDSRKLDVARIMIHTRRVFIDSRTLFYVNQIWNSSSKCNISLLPGNLVISGP